MLRNALRGLSEKRPPSATRVLQSLNGDEIGLQYHANRSKLTKLPEIAVYNTRPLRIIDRDGAIHVSTLGFLGTGLFSKTVIFNTYTVK